MPRFTFDNAGAFTNAASNNITITAVAGNTVSADYLVYNYSGSSVDIELDIGAQGFDSAQYIRSTGSVETLTTGATTVRLDADEVIDLNVTAAAGTDDLSWRIGEGQSAHGISVKRGTGHTDAYITENPNITLATI